MTLAELLTMSPPSPLKVAPAFRMALISRAS
jgi:hypothetical protein